MTDTDKLSVSSSELLSGARTGIEEYLHEVRRSGKLADNYYNDAVEHVVPNLTSWLTDPDIQRLSPNLRSGIISAIESRRWADIVNAFVREVKFGTGGIRALMAFDRASIKTLQSRGIDAQILKGPNTINNIVVLRAAYGVARYLVAKCVTDTRRPKAVVGYDSRVQGAAFAKLVCELFVTEGLDVYLFDEAVPYPEVTFAIPHLAADVGVFISASHNDYRYNGFKLSGPNGAQLSFGDRDVILRDYILPARARDIRPVRLEDAPVEILARLFFLGGKTLLPGTEYYGREGSLIDIHTAHVNHVKGFLLRGELLRPAADGTELTIVYSAFNGSGRRAVPRILRELGVRRLHSISALDGLDGLFPAFNSDPGEEQQPDPGDPRSAAIALRELGADPEKPFGWADADLLIGTDPDADRCGVIVRPAPSLRAVFQNSPFLRYHPDAVLVPADDVWALVLWYRLHNEPASAGQQPEASKRFVALSHTTSDAIARLATKHRLGVLKTWVGFGWLSAGVAQAWSSDPLPRIVEGRTSPGSDRCHLVFFDTSAMNSERKWNYAAMEQSNGFSILGGPPRGFPQVDRSMGEGGHVRDKDGTLAALLVAEIAGYAKRERTDILSLLARHVYSDPDVGLFANYYEPDPLDGEYPGLEGDTKKKAILDSVFALLAKAKTGQLVIGGRAVKSSQVYWTGKYDGANWEGFPDEGIRFFFAGEYNHLTVRPSGTTNSLRFHVQLFAGAVREQDAWAKRLLMDAEARAIVDDLRSLIGAPRSSDVF